jgi:hypothetical protein
MNLILIILLGFVLFGACKNPPNFGYCLGEFLGKFLQTLIYGYIVYYVFYEFNPKILLWVNVILNM